MKISVHHLLYNETLFKKHYEEHSKNHTLLISVEMDVQDLLIGVSGSASERFPIGLLA